ncbi:Aste57867_25510 [Aphanomyces stellatus]|uniref:Aste57867_25510 protein n=1 Tax=Aphanomyces stellatus TaxID=120398 RepID=A0A485LT88_9STRA|nr:hypothetical protein As57867_025431 [Aphanomyces stellatus]VFU02133.1 Aste57867_25510 [Aphanomyces stellatus]
MVLLAPVALLILAALASAYILPLFTKQVDFRGKHILITGGSQGLGKELALQLVDQGANVTIVARRAEPLQAGSRRNHRPGAVKTAEASPFGPIDLVVCNAGSSSPGSMADMAASVHHKAMERNYFGQLNTVRAVLPGMIACCRGSILFIASAAGLASYIGYASNSPT